jgi:endonuclease/exonuclease/phosphatase family metal-dependent hydrolase
MFDNNVWCCQNQIKPLFNNINDFDYYEPIKKFNELYEYFPYDSKQHSKIIKNKPLEQNDYNDLAMNYYIKCKTNISIIVIYPSALKLKNQINDLYEELKQNGTIHYIKTLEFTYYMAYNLIYQLYATEKRMKKNSDILYKLNRLGFDINSNKQIQILVYELTNKNRVINGKSAEYKQYIRDIFTKEDIKTTNYKPEGDRYPRGYDYIHVSDDINQSYEYSGIFLNKNSIKFLNRQKSWRILEMFTPIKKFNKLKNFMYNYSQLELEQLLIQSSGVIFSYGVRECNDIDGILLPNKIIEPIKIEGFGESIDISFKGTSQYNDTWEKELDKRAKLLGAKNHIDLVINPKYYYYFMGFKFTRLKYDLIIRYNRSRPAQFTDLLVIRQMFGLNYKLSIPTQTKQYNKELEKDEFISVNKNKYLTTMQFYLKDRYFINLDIENINKWINMSYKPEIKIDDSDEYLSDIDNSKYKLQDGGNLIEKYFNILQNQSELKYIYPSQEELIKLGYSPKVTIYSDDKPYLYPGEDFNHRSVTKFCNIKTREIRNKFNNLRIATLNVHNFISRCNQGLAPFFGTILNPFESPKDINKFIKLINSLDCDVICLQEIIPIIKDKTTTDITNLEYIRENFNFNYLNELMNNIGFKYKIIGTTQQGNFMEHELRDYYYLANAIYSKNEIINSTIYGFNFLNRNIINIKIKWNNQDISIYNTHLEYFNDKSTVLQNNNINILPKDYQFEALNNLLNSDTNKNIIICGDFNINLFRKGEGSRYSNWENNLENIKKKFINTSKLMFPTNFSQSDQTHFILINNSSSIKPKFANIVETNISDHYLVLTDFY